MWRVDHGDCLPLMAAMPEASVDAIVTDPPYGLGFMGKAWDKLPPGIEWAEACLRVLKPGGYMLAFGGTRTYHRLACAVEDGGFEIRDQLQWLYGSGFPKGKACLKPAHEPIVLARKPAPRMTPLNVDGCRIGSEAPAPSGRDVQRDNTAYGSG
jgi:DNA modification methylase